jgi:hypothetical protein
MLSKKTFKSAMLGLSELFPEVELTKSRMELYYNALKDMSDDNFNKSIGMLLQKKTFNKFPLPGEIYTQLQQGGDDQAVLAYQELRKAFAIGRYESISFEDPTINDVVNALGGWVKVCDTPIPDQKWLEKDFIKLYKVYVNREPKIKYLAGIKELRNPTKPEVVTIKTNKKELLIENKS